jgi:hypothetical protein
MHLVCYFRNYITTYGFMNVKPTIQLQCYFTPHNAKAKPIVPSHPRMCLPNGFLP